MGRFLSSKVFLCFGELGNWPRCLLRVPILGSKKVRWVPTVACPAPRVNVLLLLAGVGVFCAMDRLRKIK